MPKRAKAAYYAAQAIAERHLSEAAVNPIIAATHLKKSKESEALSQVVVSYRLFCMDELGKIVGVETLDAASDDEAIEHAHLLDLGPICELWDGQRMVARFVSRATA